MLIHSSLVGPNYLVFWLLIIFCLSFNSMIPISNTAQRILKMKILTLFVRSQKNHSPNSCKWEDPSENGAYSVSCALGTCEGVQGSYIKQSAGRIIIRCNPGHVLVQGNERDTCLTGEWTSIAHKCVRKYNHQPYWVAEVQSGLTPKS